PLLFEFLGVSDPGRPPPEIDPEAKQRRLFGLLRSVIDLQAERQPALILIDDLHWIDHASHGWVAEIAEIANGRRFLFLVNFRPEYEAAWMTRPWYQQLSLLPLGAEAVEELLDDLLGRDAQLVSLRERIHERTAGNPFFIEEVVRSLSESKILEGGRGRYRLARPIEAIEIPGTVKAVLAARIDRLAEGEKELLHAAAVIGKSFPEPVLQRVSGLPESELRESLSTLEQAELVFARALYPEAEYEFSHPLTHEVAYGSQLAERRRRVHAAVAAAIEDLYADALDERAALVAHHWESAGEPLPAARWQRRAAHFVIRTDQTEATRRLRRVRELTADLVDRDEEARRIFVRASVRLLHVGWFAVGLDEEEVARIYESTRRIAQRLEDSARWLSRLEARVAFALVGRSPSEIVLHHGEEALRLADAASSPTVWLDACQALLRAYTWAGPIDAGLALAEQAEGLITGLARDELPLELGSRRAEIAVLHTALLSLRGIRSARLRAEGGAENRPGER
ncbi:MAG: ATP-binding protein, partial [Candidatus Binatia bacterium]